jgi:hypothetical protein
VLHRADEHGESPRRGEGLEFAGGEPLGGEKRGHRVGKRLFGRGLEGGRQFLGADLEQEILAFGHRRVPAHARHSPFPARLPAPRSIG